jgi:2-dehydropantoate 2-reductase
MVIDGTARIVVAGAGSIGCYVGGCLAAAGRRVGLLLRPGLADAIGGRGLRISDLGGADRTLTLPALTLATDPAAAFAGVQIVLVAVKSGDTAAMAELIARHAPPDAVVVSLQNGVGNPAMLRARLLESQRAVAGMVPFNVVQARAEGAAPRFHRATSGTLLIGAGVPGLRALLNVPGVAVAEHPDMTGVLWGKLILNLNNALNALSDLPLAQELADRRWRRALPATGSEFRTLKGRTACWRQRP